MLKLVEYSSYKYNFLKVIKPKVTLHFKANTLFLMVSILRAHLIDMDIYYTNCSTQKDNFIYLEGVALDFWFRNFCVFEINILGKIIQPNVNFNTTNRLYDKNYNNKLLGK